MSTERAKEDASLQRVASADKGSISEDPLPTLQDASPPAVHSAIRPKIDYSSAGAFFKSFGR